MGSEAASPSHRPIYVTGELSGADAGTGAGNDRARRGSRGREFATWLRDGAIRSAAASDGGFRAIRPATGRMAKHTARVATRVASHLGQFCVSAGGTVFSTAAETGTARG